MKKIITAIAILVLAGEGFSQGLLNRSGGLNRPNRLGLNRPTAPAAAGAEASAVSGSTNPSDPGASKVDVGGRSIEFNGAALDIVLMVYGNLVGKTVLKDPSAPAATITLQPKQGQDLTDEDKILAIETVLEMNGVHLEPYGEKFVRALPRGTVRKDGIPLIMDPDVELGESTKVVSLMLTFRNIALDEAQKALEGLKSDKGVLNVFERTSSILVTDTEMNIQRMREIAKSIDVPTPVTENVFVRQIKNAAAQDIKTALEAIVQESQKELEKQGKQANQAQQNRPGIQPMQPRTLLGRPGTNNPQPTPTVNESLVTSVSDADRGMIRGKVLILSDERSNKLIIVTSQSNMNFFDKVIDQLDVETTPDIAVKVYRLKYADAEDVADMINDLIGNASNSKNSSRANQNQNAKNGTGTNVTRSNTSAAPAKKSVNQRTGETKTGELSKDNTTVLADKRINGLVVMTNKDLVPTLEQIIESMDIKLSQVLIETCIIEVQLGDDISSGIDWVQKGRQKVHESRQMQNPIGQNMFYKQQKITRADGSTSTSVLPDFPVAEGFSRSWTSDDGTKYEESASTVKVMQDATRIARDGILNYASAGAWGVGGGASGGNEALGLVSGVSSNLLNKSFTAVFDSDKLGLAAILHASESDSRSKYIASPIIMTLDNKEAVINATQMHYLLKGFTSSGNSYSTIAVPDYEQKELGIEIKVTPKINPNGTVMLTVEEKYTQLGAKETIQYSSSNGQNGGGGLQSVLVPTTITREMNSDVLLENNQTVVFAGLTDKMTSESETGIPFLKDIPWIGKWLFSSVEQTETRTELLVFMTPYVLDDAQAAQAEALRRKKTIADPRPWDDDGWSLSPLADPVSKKEQIRRLKEEAAKQDEERKTKMAIEKWKVERAKQIQEMSAEERKLWLEMHKDDLEAEKKDEEAKALEEQMLDKDSQDMLKKLAAEIREKKLNAADAEIKQMEEATHAENERSKLDAEKAKADLSVNESK